jgi:hypothetical protein
MQLYLKIQAELRHFASEVLHGELRWKRQISPCIFQVVESLSIRSFLIIVQLLRPWSIFPYIYYLLSFLCILIYYQFSDPVLYIFHKITPVDS